MLMFDLEGLLLQSHASVEGKLPWISILANLEGDMCHIRDALETDIQAYTELSAPGQPGLWFGTKDKRVFYLRIWLGGQTGAISRSKASTISGLTFCFCVAKWSADGCWTEFVPLTYPLPEALPFCIPVSLRSRWDRSPAFFKPWQAEPSPRLAGSRFPVPKGGAAIKCVFCTAIELTCYQHIVWLRIPAHTILRSDSQSFQTVVHVLQDRFAPVQRSCEGSM